MKLVLAQPPVQDYYETLSRLQPIGLAYLAGAVKKYIPGSQVIIKDYHNTGQRKSIPLPNEMKYLNKYWIYPDKSPFSSFYQYYHFGTDFDKAAEDILSQSPDYVGISALFTPYYMETINLARAIKARSSVPIIVGGSAATVIPKVFIQEDAIDYVIIGEGEKPLVRLLYTLNNKKGLENVPNLIYKHGSEIFENPRQDNFPINELPYPALEGQKPGNYRYRGKPACMIITSRGCPYGCSFCSVRKTFGKKYRKRKASDIINEIKMRYNSGYRVFDFEDDNLTFDKKEATVLFEMIIEEFKEKDVELVAQNGLSYKDLDNEILLLMKKAGFKSLNLSLVSSDESVQEYSLRKFSISKFQDIANIASWLGFEITAHVILGLPGSSLISMIDSIAFLSSLPLIIGPSMYYQTPGLCDKEEAPTHKAILTSRLTAMAIETDQFSRDDIYTLFLSCRIINYLKNLKLDKNNNSFNETLEAAKKAGGRTALGADLLKKLFRENKLHAFTGKEYKVIPKFKSQLFFKLWDKLGTIKTVYGNEIN